jgi:type IV pilus assembly protein PilO
MAIAFREFPWYIQALFFAALAVVLVLAGEFIPYSPVQQARINLSQLKSEEKTLSDDVHTLEVYERKYGEFKADMEALQKQMDTLKTIVPEDKELDEFMRLVQGAATASGVQIRRLAALPVATRDYHFEMPFEVQVDGPYFSILDFFSRLSRLSRIINVGDISFSGLGGAQAAKYPVRPGTTVTGTFVASTFFTKAGDEAAGKAPAKQPGKQ